MVLTRRGSAQVEAQSLQTAARASSSFRSSRLTRSSLQRLDRAATGPSQALSAAPSPSPEDSVIASISASDMPSINSSDALPIISRRPSDEWREFFQLDDSTAPAEEGEQPPSEAKDNSDEATDDMLIDQDVSWDSVFADTFSFGANQGSSRSALGSTATQRPGRSIQSASSVNSPLEDLDSYSTVSMASTAPTSYAPSPAANISECDAPLPPSVLQPVLPSVAASSTSLSSFGAFDGYSSIMPRRPPSSAAPPTPKVRKGRSAIDVLKARTEAKKTYPGGTAAWLSLAESERPFVADALPSSAPATTTVFERRLALSSGDRKPIKAEGSEVKKPSRARGPTKTKPTLAKKASVDEIAPAVETQKVAAPRQRKPKVKPGGHTPRPPNAWILYRSAQIQILKSDSNISKKPQSDISKLIGYMWRDESPEVRKYYEDQAAIKKAEHVRMYPDYTFCPVRKPKGGEAASAKSSRASTPAAEPQKGRPGLARRSTAPAARSAPYSPRKRRSTENVQSTPETVAVTVPSCLLDFDFTQLPSPTQPNSEAFIPHSSSDYESNFALEKSMEALMASFGSTSSQGGSLAMSPCTPGYQRSLDCLPPPLYDIDGLLQSPVDPSTYAAWTALESTTPNYFPENPLDFLPQAPLSAPAAYSAFKFGPVPSPFEQFASPNGDQYSLPITSTSAAETLGAFDPYTVPAPSSSSASSYPTFSLPSLSDIASPTNTESSLASPGATFLGEQLQPPFEMQWERTEGGCGITTAELDYKRRLSTQWTGAHAEQVAY